MQTTIEKHLPEMIGTLASLPVKKADRQPSQQKSLPKIQTKNRPLRTEWQQRWIGMETAHPAIQELADAGEEMAKAFFYHQPTRNLILVGDSGSGKTHFSKSLRRWAQMNAQAAFDARNWDRKGGHPEVLFVSWPEVTEGYYKGAFEVTQEYVETDLLFIDDLGAERDPKVLATDKLCQILSRREKRYTVITTNIQPQHWISKWDERIADRLMRNTRVIDLTGVPSFSCRE